MAVGLVAIGILWLGLVLGYRARPGERGRAAIRAQGAFQVAACRSASPFTLGYTGFYVMAYVGDFSRGFPFALAVSWLVVCGMISTTTALFGKPAFLVVPMYRGERLRGRRARR